MHNKTSPLMNQVSVLTILKYINDASFELARRSCASFGSVRCSDICGSLPVLIFSGRCLLRHQLLEAVSSRERPKIKFTR